MDDLPKDLHIIMVRRGEGMRLMLPMVPRNLWDTTSFELATLCVRSFEKLQEEEPGRADMPITPGVMHALFLPHALGPLIPEMMVGPQLMGHWQEASVAAVENNAIVRSDTPVCLLNLIDTNVN